MKRQTFLPLLPVCSAALISAGHAAESPRKPNVIIILADDLGYNDLSIQGGSIPTPNIDSLARNGIRCTQAYVTAPVCSPSRAGLLTGRYQNRFGFEFLADPGSPVPEGRKIGLASSKKTIADRMKALGYVTGCIGKWHVGWEPEFLPMNRGFDEFYGTPGQGNYFAPTLIDSRKGEKAFKFSTPGYYLTDDYSDHAVDFINRHKDQPFFLYMAHFAVHKPFEATEKYLSRFPEIADKNKKTRAAMLSALDDAVGALTEALRQNRLEENTLIFFLSDNGADGAGDNSPLRGGKGSTWEGGIRVPYFVQWKGHLPAGKIYSEPVSSLDILPTAVAVAGGTVDPAWELDGKNLLPHFNGTEKKPLHDVLFWRFGTQWAVRQGDWKLVQGREEKGGTIQIAKEGPMRFFNTEQDLSETNDLAAVHSEKVMELRKLWKTWAKDLLEPSWQPRLTD